MVNATPRPLYPRERHGTHCIVGLGGTDGRSGQVWKISPPTGIRSPGRSVRSEWLYRLGYPGHVHVGSETAVTSWIFQDARSRNAPKQANRCPYFPLILNYNNVVFIQDVPLETGPLAPCKRIDFKRHTLYSMTISGSRI